MPEFNQSQLILLIEALERLNPELLDSGYKQVRKHLLIRLKRELEDNK